jgi:hypothetical protein
MGSCRCGARWSGYRTAHCAKCHVTFGGLTAFDQHRPGECLDPASIGLIVMRTSGTCEIWGSPMDEEARSRFQQVKEGVLGKGTEETCVEEGTREKVDLVSKTSGETGGDGGTTQ